MADNSISPDKMIASLLEGKSRREIMVILARLEHGGAGIYESLAKQEKNQKAREALLAGAQREEQNSALLKLMTTTKDKCEKCGKSVPDAADALACSFQCTFCPECASGYNHVCPNCSGELTSRSVSASA
jgi:membrane protease subunit (stomatin/prohibitin family)